MTVPERWLALRVRVTEPLDRELAAEVLVDAGGRGVVEEDDGVVTYLPEPEDPQTALNELRERLAARISPPPAVDDWWQAQEDWAEIWKRGLAPRAVTDRVLIAPSWTEAAPSPGQVLVVVDPGVAFGTAEHPTTRGCIRLMDPVLEEGQTLLDIGAGTAILSMAAARLGAGRVLAVEVDPMACEAARENVELNDVRDRVQVLEATATPERLAEWGPARGVVANIESGILKPLMEGLAGAVEPGGWLILSGILQEERDEMVAAAQSAGVRLEEEDREGEWWSGRFRAA